MVRDRDTDASKGGDASKGRDTEPGRPDLVTRSHVKDGAPSTAVYSPCDGYRYSLTRTWDTGAGRGNLPKSLGRRRATIYDLHPK